MQFILDKITTAFKSKLPFVVYNKPNESDIFGFFQKDTSLHTIATNFNQSGFVFAPFDASKENVFFPLEKSEFVTDSFTKNETALGEKSILNISSKDKHVKIVESAIAAIRKNEFKKVVISRKEIVTIDGVDVEQIYNKLLQLYPNAFVYVWFHPQVGLWFGATPETLLKVENNNFSTMSLAGTQEYIKDENVIWNTKEIEEQQIVTDYILNKLSDFSINLKQGETETVKAGSLLHLRTEIKGELLNEGLYSLVNLLHPTPAVCGLPKEKAKQFILENETYNRSYYTGFLGELNIHNNSNLFVNLRCMEIKNKQAVIYVGGGITKESNPEKEWQETVAKSNIMLKVL